MSRKANLTGSNIKNRDDVVHKRVAQDVRARSAVLWTSQAVPRRRVHKVLHEHVRITDIKGGTVDLHAQGRDRGVARGERRAFVVDVDCGRVVEGDDVLVQS